MLKKLFNSIGEAIVDTPLEIFEEEIEITEKKSVLPTFLNNKMILDDLVTNAAISYSTMSQESISNSYRHILNMKRKINTIDYELALKQDIAHLLYKLGYQKKLFKYWIENMDIPEWPGVNVQLAQVSSYAQIEIDDDTDQFYLASNKKIQKEVHNLVHKYDKSFSGKKRVENLESQFCYLHLKEQIFSKVLKDISFNQDKYDDIFEDENPHHIMHYIESKLTKKCNTLLNK